MSEEKFKGSDGIERTLTEWLIFIGDRKSSVDGDDSLSCALSKLKWAIAVTFSTYDSEKGETRRSKTRTTQVDENEWKWEPVYEDEDGYDDPELEETGSAYESMLENIAKDAGDYFTQLIADAIENKPTPSSRYNYIAGHIEKLARSISSGPEAKKVQCENLGSGLERYIIERGALPTSRSDLKSFIDNERERQLTNCYYTITKPMALRAISEHLSWYKLKPESVS